MLGKNWTHRAYPADMSRQTIEFIWDITDIDILKIIFEKTDKIKKFRDVHVKIMEIAKKMILLAGSKPVLNHPESAIPDIIPIIIFKIKFFRAVIKNINFIIKQT